MEAIRWRGRVKALLLIALVFPMLTGCWDRQEIEQRAVILGVGIDEADPDEETEGISQLEGSIPSPKTEMVRVTVQIAVPGRIPLGPGGGGGGGGGIGGGGGGNTVWVLESLGQTVNDAMNSLQQKVALPLFFGHLRVIAVSEAVAKKGIKNMNDYFKRAPEVRRLNWMLICKGKAKDLMKAIPQLERVPTLYLVETMDQSIKMGRFPNAFLGIFWSFSSAKGREGFLPYVSLKKENAVEISGIAFFKNDTMVGVTKPLEIPMYMGIVGLNPGGEQGFVQVPGTTEYVMFGGRNRKSTIKTVMKNGEPVIQVKIEVEGNIIEKSNDEVLITDKVIKQIEQQLAQQSTTAFHNLIKKTQEKGSDIFGFGEHIRAKRPKYWNREIRTKEKWQEHYKELPVEVSVTFHVRRVGMKAN